MTHRSIFDIRFEVGTIITAKVNPGLKLLIMRYFEGIYYCAVVGNAGSKLLTYRENDFIAPDDEN
jgi:hypothetical protein